MLEKFLSEQIFKQLENLHSGSLTIETPDHKKYAFKGDKEGGSGHIVIHHWPVISAIAAKGDIGLAETYRDNLWSTPDLLGLLTVLMQNRDLIEKYTKANIFQNFFIKLYYLTQMNSLEGSRKNIQAHYDLGNDFYSLWLDPSMTYSSAIYGADNDLTKAQHNKYDRIIDQLNSNSGRLLEIGCGWGGFAERVQHRDKDINVKGITLSDEQHAFAQERLDNNAQIVIEDYRKQEGQFDHIVSIEMFEAVGEKYWPVYFSKVKELLSQKGKAVIQTITVRNDEFEKYKKESDFIRSHIFPGGLLPSPERFKEEARKVGLKTNNQFEFGLDYARTLEEWLQNFDSVKDKVKALGFDEPFIHMWRFYLAGCAAGFHSGYTNVQQIELEHA